VPPAHAAEPSPGDLTLIARGARWRGCRRRRVLTERPSLAAHAQVGADSGRPPAYGRDMTRRHPFTIGRTALLGAVLAACATAVLARDNGDGALYLPVLMLVVGAFIGYFVGLAVDRK